MAERALTVSSDQRERPSNHEGGLRAVRALRVPGLAPGGPKLPMRRWRLFAGLGAYRLFGVGEAVGEALHVAPEAVEFFPLLGDRRVELLDRPLVVGDADFELVDTGGVLGHGQVFMTAAALMLHARP